MEKVWLLTILDWSNEQVYGVYPFKEEPTKEQAVEKLRGRTVEVWCGLSGDTIDIASYVEEEWEEHTDLSEEEVL